MLGKLFRKKTLAELKNEAEALYAEGKLGEAKLAYDRLEARAEKEDAALAAEARDHATKCCDELAAARIVEATELHKRGLLDLAREELKHALDTARSPAMLERVHEAGRALERRDAVQHATKVAELSDDERVALIAGSWEPLQAEELERYGEPLMQAILELDRERGPEAVKILESILTTAKEPSYLYLELGRARLVAQDLEGGERDLMTFLSRIGPEEGGTARLLAHRELVRLAHERGDRESALSQLEAAAEALDPDPRPYLDLGAYLRMLGRPAEAVEVLEQCAALFENERVEWPVLMELGLAYAEAGTTSKGIDALESVIEQVTQRGQRDLPPAAVVALAKLHEKEGNLARAADLYRALTEGSDGENHGLYHREAARLLGALGLADEARRMNERAAAIEAPRA